MSNPDIHRTVDIGMAALCVCFYGQDVLVGIDRGAKCNTFLLHVDNTEYQAMLADYSRGQQPIEDAKTYIDAVKFVLKKQAEFTTQHKQFGAMEWRPLEWVGVV
jgi:hypothetical protein